MLREHLNQYPFGHPQLYLFTLLTPSRQSDKLCGTYGRELRHVVRCVERITSSVELRE